ncbi:hypothetical protein Tco_1308811, partial [Tanacetum coccineum]
MAGDLGARNAARNLELLMRDGGRQEEVNGNGGNKNGGNGNGGNGNGNGNGGGNGYNIGGFVPTRECTYQDFLKCQPLSFNRREGVVGLTRWFEKMETVFHISNHPEKYQVKYAMCMLLNSAKLVKLMTEVYCTRNKVQKIKTELWNLVVKGNDLTTYTRRVQELVLLCTRMVPNEEDKVERFVGGLPDNIQGNCGRPRHFRKDYPKLRNQNCRNKTGNKNGNKTGNKNGNKTGNQIGNQTKGNEATEKAYAIGGGGANPDSNFVT